MILRRNQQGQISIFFSASLVVLVSIVAFVINVGLFVKAKINLQNATDAAAYAGASVQARQLSRIAFLNWEMRNVFKEWMYKYYVIGNLNINDVPAAQEGQNEGMNFRMEPDYNPLSGSSTQDPYNVPSVCIHLSGSESNICRRFAIPGLPEFGSSNLPGAEAASRAFQDALINTKVLDCVQRTKLNMLVATTWAYNVLSASGINFGGQTPPILADRQGAWPRAVELAIRIRNLEAIVNAPARTGGVCLNPGGGVVSCAAGISGISSEPAAGNERVVKAFYSGFRNIGGSFDGDEMKNSFTLTELKPKDVVNNQPANASNLLLPDTALGKPKRYLDLKLMMVNYAIFYSAMIPRADSGSSGACDVSKAAIPVPGYPLGFYKSPDVLTYYAVKGEAEFVGMFNPFSEQVKMTAYAAAKPMGGRIGPMLFTQPAGSDGIMPRSDNDKLRSVPYILTLKVTGAMQRFPIGGGNWQTRVVGVGEYAPGMPFPVNGSTDATSFWLNDPSRAVGGKIPGGVMFGIPSLVYDYKAPFTTDGYLDSGTRLATLQAGPPGADKPIGLYSKDQFARFRGNITTGAIDFTAMDSHIARVRAPTQYDVANYMVPVPVDFTIAGMSDGTPIGHFGQIVHAGPGLKGENVGQDTTRYRMRIWAPLHGDEPTELLYKNPAQVLAAVTDFMVQQETGMKKYVDSMNDVAKKIYDQGAMTNQAASGSQIGYQQAAAGVSDINFAANPVGQVPKSCDSLAGTFLYFFYQGIMSPPKIPTTGSCPVSLSTLLQTYFNASAADPNFKKEFYNMEFSWRPKNFDSPRSPVPQNMGVLSAYVPGPFTGSGNDGIFDNLSGIKEMTRRNFYSTKLVALKAFTGPGYTESATQFATMSEGQSTVFGNDTRQQTGFINPLENPDEVKDIKH